MSPIRAIVKGTILVFCLMFSSMVVYGQGSYPPENDPYINDYARIIKPEDAKQIQELLIDLKNTNNIDMVVLTINSIRDYPTGDTTIESFATNVFNEWGIGDSATNKGVLILVAIQDREVRIELGSGYGNEKNAAMQKVIDKFMLPSFRESQFSRGIYSGVWAAIAELTGTLPSSNISQATPIPSKMPTRTVSTPRPVVTSPSKGNNSNEGIVLLVLAIIVGILVYGVSKHTRYARYRKRKCPNCGAAMNRLDEDSNNTYLNSGQKLEEKLLSVDYDVWKCPSCGKHSIHSYPNLSSNSKKCPQCEYRTLGVTKKIIKKSTNTSTGRVEIVTKCRHCKYHNKEIITLPILIITDLIDGNNAFNDNTFNDNTTSSHSDSGGQSSGDGASGKW